MRLKTLLTGGLIFFSACARASDAAYFKFDELVRSESIQEALAKDVNLYFDIATTPEFSEVSKPDTYTRSSISISPFGGSKRHCIDAFEKALVAMIADARRRGYDAIIKIRAVQNEKPSTDSSGFFCKPGYKTTEVPLSASFAMTPAAMKRLTESEEKSTNLPSRAPAEGARFLSLKTFLMSQEARAATGPDIETFIGAKSPAYSERYGPDLYSEDADIGNIGPEEACKLAVIKALSSMVQDAKEKGFDSIIRIRSFLDEQLAPAMSDVECRVGKKTASVTLQASLANRK